MIRAGNRIIIKQDNGQTGDDLRGLLTQVEAGAISFWCKLPDGTTEHYRKYSYLDDEINPSVVGATCVLAANGYEYDILIIVKGRHDSLSEKPLWGYIADFDTHSTFTLARDYDATANVTFYYGALDAEFHNIDIASATAVITYQSTVDGAYFHLKDIVWEEENIGPSKALSVEWGHITGALSKQLDLSAALALKANEADYLVRNIVAGTNITLDYNSTTKVCTINASSGDVNGPTIESIWVGNVSYHVWIKGNYTTAPNVVYYAYSIDNFNAYHKISGTYNSTGDYTVYSGTISSGCIVWVIITSQTDLAPDVALDHTKLLYEWQRMYEMVGAAPIRFALGDDTIHLDYDTNQFNVVDGKLHYLGSGESPIQIIRLFVETTSLSCWIRGDQHSIYYLFLLDSNGTYHKITGSYISDGNYTSYSSSLASGYVYRVFITSQSDYSASSQDISKMLYEWGRESSQTYNGMAPINVNNQNDQITLKYDDSQFEVNTDGELHYKGGSSDGVEWGDITGTLSKQIDLQSALDSKFRQYSWQSAIIAGTGIQASFIANSGEQGRWMITNTGSTSSIIWGEIDGNLPDQIDLGIALGLKANEADYMVRNLMAGDNISFNYNPGTKVYTINASGGGSSSPDILYISIQQWNAIVWLRGVQQNTYYVYIMNYEEDTPYNIPGSYTASGDYTWYHGDSGGKSLMISQLVITKQNDWNGLNLDVNKVLYNWKANDLAGFAVSTPLNYIDNSLSLKYDTSQFAVVGGALQWLGLPTELPLKWVDKKAGLYYDTTQFNLQDGKLHYMGGGADLDKTYATYLTGSGESQYVIKHDLNDASAKEVSGSPYNTPAQLPTQVPSGQTWNVGDYAFVRMGNYYDVREQYVIKSIDGAVIWTFEGPLKGEFLGAKSSVADLPLYRTMGDQRVGNFYRVVGGTVGTRGIWIISGVNESDGRITYSQFAGIDFTPVITTMMDRHTSEYISATILQMFNVLYLEFGYELPNWEEYIVHCMKPSIHD